MRTQPPAGDDGRVHALTFSLEINGRPHTFRLPARVENVERLLYGERDLTETQKEQAYKTAWARSSVMAKQPKTCSLFAQITSYFVGVATGVDGCSGVGVGVTVDSGATVGVGVVVVALVGESCGVRVGVRVSVGVGVGVDAGGAVGPVCGYAGVAGGAVGAAVGTNGTGIVFCPTGVEAVT